MKLTKAIPIFQWLPSYKKSWLKNDAIAGFTIGVLLIPQGIAYAMIAGLPPIYGLYTAMIPQIVYAFLGTSRQLAVGPAALDSLIVASGVSTVAIMGTENFISAAILLAFMVGVIQVIFGFLKLGFFVNFLSRPVISGFTSAAGLIIALNQIKHITGISISRNNQVQLLVVNLLKHLKQLNLTTFILGTSTILLIVLMKKYVKKIPSSLLVVVLGILLAKYFNLQQYGVAIVGTIPKGLPSFKLIHFSTTLISDLLPIAITLALIAYTEAISLSKALEAKHKSYRIDPNQEFIALGFGNIIGSLFQGYSSTGGFSRTAVNDQAGAKTPLSSIFAALIIGLTLLYLTPVFYYLPKAVLGAIIFVAVLGLIDFKMPQRLLKFAKPDLVILLITFLVTTTIGIKEGIIIGVLLSLVIFIYNTTIPHIAILGKVPGTHFYRNKNRFKNVKIEDDILIIRYDAQLHYANASYFKDKLEEYAIQKGPKLKLIIIVGESINRVDSGGVFTLGDMISDYNKKGIIIYFTGLKGPVRDIFQKSGVIDKIGHQNCFMSIQEAVDHFKTNKESKYKEYINQVNN